MTTVILTLELNGVRRTYCKEVCDAVSRDRDLMTMKVNTMLAHLLDEQFDRDRYVMDDF